MCIRGKIVNESTLSFITNCITMTLRILTLCLSFFFIINLNAQNAIQGQITDNKDKSLAFVNIIVNNDNRKGQITDIDGLFSFDKINIGDKLYLSYLGYEPLIYTITTADFGNKIIIQMQVASYQLEEIAIIAGENPAHRIIKNVVKNRNKNNPEKYDKYRCETYNKMRLATISNFKKYKEEVIDKRENEPTESQIERDKNIKSEKNFADKYYMAIMETVTDKQFIAPNSHKEIVLHNKVSGLKRPEFIALAKDLQPFSFYEPQITILQETYLNPISKGSTKIYYFDWTDTLINGQDSIFIIQFQPKKGKIFEGLKGVLYIHSNQYAIQNIIAEPADITMTSIRIEQKYKYHADDNRWFPEQLNMEWFLEKYPSEYLGLRIEGKSYIKKVDFQPEIQKRNFTKDKFIMADDVFDLKNDGWKTKRADALTIKEVETYAFIDSVSEKNNVEQKLNAVYSIFDTKLSLGKVDLNLDRIIAFNDYENVRVGAGFQTNEKLIKNLSIGGYAAYGIKDKAFKYGGEIDWKISKKYDMNLVAGYQNDLKIPGSLDVPRWKFPFWRVSENLYQPMMDNLEEFYGQFNTNVFKYGTFNIRYTHQNITPNSEYQYNNDVGIFEQFSFQELSLGLRYAYGEQTISFMGMESPNPTNYPIFHMNLTAGNWLEANTNYQKIVVGIEQKISLHRLGSLEYNIEAGFINGELPWTKLFNSRGLGIGFQPVIIPYTFQTMNPNEYLSSEFVHLFLKYNIGTLSKRTEYFQPELSVVHNQAWGSLNNKSYHSQTFKTLENGFFESGIELNNLYRYNYLDVAYLGVGAGIYANHRNLQLDDLQSNISYRFLLTLDF